MSDHCVSDFIGGVCTVVVMDVKMVKTARTVLPGDTVDIVATCKEKCVLGPGLRKEGERIVAIRPGVLKQNANNIYYVEGHQKRVSTLLLFFGFPV